MRPVTSHPPGVGPGLLPACRLYGLGVSSQIPLGLPVGGGGPTDLVIRLGHNPSPAQVRGRLVAWSPCPAHGVDIQVWRSPDGAAWIWNRAIGEFYVDAYGRTVEVYPQPGADPRAIRAVLLGPIITFVLHRRGRPTLHASAVLVGGRVVAFVGGRGRGKSTLAAAFLTRGHTIFTDDVLPLTADGGSVLASPGPPHMKLWPDTAGCTLGLETGLPDVLPGVSKKIVALDAHSAAEPAPLAAVYALERSPPDVLKSGGVRVEALRGHTAAAVLLAHTPNRSYLLATEEARFLPVYAGLVSRGFVKRLAFPTGFDHLEDVYHQVLSDLD